MENREIAVKFLGGKGFFHDHVRIPNAELVELLVGWLEGFEFWFKYESPDAVPCEVGSECVFHRANTKPYETLSDYLSEDKEPYTTGSRWSCESKYNDFFQQCVELILEHTSLPTGERDAHDNMTNNDLDHDLSEWLAQCPLPQLADPIVDAAA